MLDRIILTVYMLFMSVVSIVLIVLSFGLVPSDIVRYAADMLTSHWYYALIGLVLLVLSIRLLVSAVSSEKRANGGVMRSSENGEIRISLETFESLATKAVRQVSGIRDTKVRVDAGLEGLIVNVKLTVLPDVNIPKTVSDVQSSIKSYLESITEVLVKEVPVKVENVSQTNVPRVS